MPNWTPALAATAAAIPPTLVAVAQPCCAATLDGGTLSWAWVMPFVGLLVMIAIAPILTPRLWQRHYGKIAAGWSLFTVAAIAAKAGIAVAIAAVLQAMLADYLSFIVMLFALYVAAGGILVTGNLHGSPLGNAGMLFVGMVLASVVGTTGAAMIVVRPLIRANQQRRHNAHVAMFAIFLVANIGGAVTPLGNPPLFVGYLHGVDFFWTVGHLMPAACFIAALVLAVWSMSFGVHGGKGQRSRLLYCLFINGKRFMQYDDPAFWRAGAISTTVVMSAVLIMLTLDSLAAISPGGSHVPPYTVINRHIGYAYDGKLGRDMPVLGADEPLFDKPFNDAEAAALIDRGKLVIQSRACMDCHTFMGNGAYYAPDLTKAWLDPAWDAWIAITGATAKDEAMARFLMAPDQYATWQRRMPNLGISRDEAEATVAYLKWLSSIDTNGFPIHFGRIKVTQ